MPNFRYRALNDRGGLVIGALVAPDSVAVAQRVEQLGLVLVESVAVEDAAPSRLRGMFNRPRPEDVTGFTRDLALLLRAGARINDGLELLASDNDLGRLRPVVADIRTRVVSGDSFAEALSRHTELFPAM